MSNGTSLVQLLAFMRQQVQVEKDTSVSGKIGLVGYCLRKRRRVCSLDKGTVEQTEVEVLRGRGFSNSGSEVLKCRSICFEGTIPEAAFHWFEALSKREGFILVGGYTELCLYLHGQEQTSGGR